MNNVLFVSGIGGDTRRYRCLHHQEQLALHGVASTLRTADDLHTYADITTHDLLILHRTPYSQLVGDLIDLAHLRGLPVIFETDDLIFEPELYSSIAFLDTLSPEAAQRFRQDLHGQAKSFALSDFILTTTDYLAEAARRHGKTAFVHRNACSAEMVRTAEIAYATRAAHQVEKAPPDEQPVVIGYFSGTGSHNRDFALITPALLTILARYPNVWLHVSGQLELDGRFLAYRERIRRAPFVTWQELPNLVAQVDINLAPLELDNPFCQAKSEIKYTEAALVGVPTIASPTEAFTYAVQNGETGLLADSEAAWLAALTHLIEQPAERRRMGEAARRQVYADYAPEPRSQELVATLHQIEQVYTPVADPARVPLTLATALLRQIAGLVEEQQQQARQLTSLRQTLAAWEAKSEDSQAAFWRLSYEQSEAQQTEALRTILARLQRTNLSD
jgi:glycosyltransferase involved in cell wall biosynthesis